MLYMLCAVTIDTDQNKVIPTDEDDEKKDHQKHGMQRESPVILSNITEDTEL